MAATRNQPPLRQLAVLAAWFVFSGAGLMRADSITLKDGRVLEGRFAKLSGVAVDPLNAAAKSNDTVGNMLIMLCDNELTRVMIPTRQIRAVNAVPAGPPPERIKIDQPVAHTGLRVASVGPILNITDFDAFGRRIFSMSTVEGRVDIIQGITEITPLWAKVEGLQSEKSYVWDMRIATSSIPRETLIKILNKRIDRKNREHRLRVVRLFIQSQRFQDARTELEQVIADFPNLEELKAEVKSLREVSARRLMSEIEARQQAGQHRLAYTMLKQFPPEDVADETLIQVRQKIKQYAASEHRAKEILQQLDAHLALIDDPVLKRQLSPICDEIHAELYMSTLDRMASYERLAGDEKLDPEQRIALAISGWLLGANEATENPTVALSLIDVRRLVRAYLAEPVKANREEIFIELQAQEGFTPKLVAQLMAQMKPPLETPASKVPGFFELQVPGIDQEPDVTYLVQLPPEYDPYRLYPAVVTLNGGGTTPLHQIDWWAGAANKNGDRLGQATRQGCIVIAPTWSKPHQRKCEHSLREHAAVLSSLRDACRRFAIDTDRVFLSGHSMGGDAAWDIGLSHPDLWAGVIPIVATSGNVVAQYWPNAQQLPLYFIGGELDGDKLVRNARDLDRYLNKGFDVTVVEYLGRGHEHFSDEIQRLFDWMGRKQRNFFPKEFQASTMRPWDNYFWWLEVKQFPPRAVAASWPPPAGTRPLKIEAGVNAAGAINIRAGAGRMSVWLSPELVDFNQPLTIIMNGSRLLTRATLGPDARVLLEDVRTRGDRQHPFWVKVE